MTVYALNQHPVEQLDRVVADLLDMQHGEGSGRIWLEALQRRRAERQIEKQRDRHHLSRVSADPSDKEGR